MSEQQPRRDEVVSFDDEPLILVDAKDREIGYLDKASAHDGHGTLHRAFSLFVFNPNGEVLLQQRAEGKRLWPGYWANTCCSHPRRGERLKDAIHRRLAEELGFDCELTHLFEFTYQASYGDAGSEHELCHVFAGRSDAAPDVNASEIAALRYVAPDMLDQEIAANPERYTPWLKLEWQRLRAQHAEWFATPA
ncbi:MAG: isopentenyl-diphosphate Delta-isomerase [Rhodanobacter sp.]|nr:MAG: isopentenyl-diphosphate Delta-isomerase [Rhodanobacter sp.]TAM13610.1 MAG: isopentenyl-diphosphate Delta-isomerase [Rhodanobacter sp.]TAM35637.1 MAG: isopentenyl-diphosphate Delta-isomerase [Rhodanobacter sp.]